MVYDSENECLHKKRSMEVPTEQIKKVVDNLSDSTMGFGGGEPTISDDFFDIIKYTRKKHPEKLIFVVSNGRMFSYKGFVRKLSSVEPANQNIRLGIALFGHTPELHDSITRAKGSFEQTVEGVANLLEKGYDVELRVIVNKMNYRELPLMARWISEEFEGVMRVVFINMKYTGNALKNFERIGVRVTDSNPYACKAAEILDEKGFNTQLFHFPLCTIPEKFWPMAEGVTKQEDLVFVDECENCSVRERCPMVWKSYVDKFGAEEFGRSE